MGDSRTQEEVECQFTDKDKLGIDNSIAAHIRWRKTYKESVEKRLSMIATCPTTEAVEYLRIEWARNERKFCRVLSRLCFYKRHKHLIITMRNRISQQCYGSWSHRGSNLLPLAQRSKQMVFHLCCSLC